jgi:hypothetical protein
MSARGFKTELVSSDKTEPKLRPDTKCIDVKKIA